MGSTSQELIQQLLQAIWHAEGSVPRIDLAVGQNQGYHLGVGEFTTHFRTYFSGWIGSRSLGVLAFDPWPLLFPFLFGMW